MGSKQERQKKKVKGVRLGELERRPRRVKIGPEDEWEWGRGCMELERYKGLSGKGEQRGGGEGKEHEDT